jgi:hypothetical protein
MHHPKEHKHTSPDDITLKSHLGLNKGVYIAGKSGFMALVNGTAAFITVCLACLIGGEKVMKPIEKLVNAFESFTHGLAEQLMGKTGSNIDITKFRAIIPIATTVALVVGKITSILASKPAWNQVQGAEDKLEVIVKKGREAEAKVPHLTEENEDLKRKNTELQARLDEFTKQRPDSFEGRRQMENANLSLGCPGV